LVQGGVDEPGGQARLGGLDAGHRPGRARWSSANAGAIAMLGILLAVVLISSKDSREQAEAARRGEPAAAPAVL